MRENLDPSITYLSALVINPESGVAKKVIDLLSESGVSVSVKASQETAKALPPTWTDNLLLTIFISDEESFPKRHFRYVIYFLKDKEGLGLVQKVLQHFSDDSKILFVIPFSLGATAIAEISQSSGGRVAVIASEIGQGMDFRRNILVTQIIRSTFRGEPLFINPKDQSGAPVAATDDLANAVLETLFTGQQRKIRWLVPEPVSLSSLLSVFSTLTNSTPTVQFDQRAPRCTEPFTLPAGIPFWLPKTPLYEAARLAIAWVNQNPQVLTPAAQVQPTAGHFPKRPSPPKMHLPKFSLRFPPAFLFFLLLLLLFALPGFLFFSLIWNTWQTADSLSKGKPGEAVIAAQSTFDKIVFLDQALTASKPLATTLGLDDLRQRLIKKISTVETLSYAEISTLRLLKTIQQWIFDQTTPLPPPPELVESFSQAADALALASLSLSQNQDWLNNLPLVGGYLSSLQKKVPTLRQAILDSRELLPHFKSLGGFGQTRTYLILFQNNMELRPTGGFIGSFGLATAREGKLINFEVNDVYAADGQLKGHVDPPAPIREVLGEAGWTLRDSNWDPDFPTSASRAQWFLEKEIGRTVDGTIAVTLNLAQELLKVTGPLKLLDYQEEVTSENLYERAQYRAEANFFPGSTQKKDYLGAVARALFAKLKNPSPGQALQLVEVLRNAVAKKDTQVYFTDPELQAAFSKLSWTGEVREAVSCPVTNCTTDSLFLVDSNLGVNKANYFLKRKIIEQIVVSAEGEIGHELSATFQNSATSDRWPAGRYRSYVRFYLPLGTKVDQVSLKNPSTGVVEKLPGVDETEEHGKFILGFPFEVPIQEVREIILSYKAATKVDLSQGGSFVLFLQKQAGTIGDPYEVAISFPPNVKITSVYPAIKDFALSNMVRYNLLLSADQRIEVNFAKSN